MLTGDDDLTVPTFLQSLPMALRAYEFAREAHREQRRESDAAEFIIHPLEVASLLNNTGHSDRVVASGVLHDILERTDTTIETIEASFGRDIARVVASVSEDESIGDLRERKHGLREQVADGGEDVAAVYAADKVAKVRELRSRVARGEHLNGAHDELHHKLEHYQASLSVLERVASEHVLVRQLRFELESLSELPPRPELLASE